MKPIYYGFYSEQHATMSGTISYLSPDEKHHMVVTCVDLHPGAPNYQWPDKECLGPVGKFIKNHQATISPYKLNQ